MHSFFIFFLSFNALFLLIDVLQRQVFKNSQWSRRATHIFSSIIAFYMPVYLGKYQIVAMGFIFVAILLVSKRKNILSLHWVKRSTLGELYYPLAIAIMPIFCMPQHPEAFQLAVLILGFSDGLAGLIGEKWPYKPIKLCGHCKTLGGSMVFFAITISILLLFPVTASLPFTSLVLFAMGLTALEFLLFYGLDNLFLPLAVMWGYIWLLG